MWWHRDGRKTRLFFAQLEAAETIIFLAEARADLRQGINIPSDEPGPDQQAEGHKAFVRYACKMATGSGKTTVMGMLAAWRWVAAVNADGRYGSWSYEVAKKVEDVPKLSAKAGKGGG